MRLACGLITRAPSLAILQCHLFEHLLLVGHLIELLFGLANILIGWVLPDHFSPFPVLLRSLGLRNILTQPRVDLTENRADLISLGGEFPGLPSFLRLFAMLALGLLRLILPRHIAGLAGRFNL